MDLADIADEGVESNKDDWHNVVDAKKRKQIQDRLAQRARRKRLREAARNQKQPGGAPAALGCDENRSAEGNLHNSMALVPARGEALELLPCSEVAVASPPSLSRPRPRTPPGHSLQSAAQGPSMSYDVPISTAVLSALMINGRVLGLSAAICVPGRSKPASPDVPPSLQPTMLQLLNVHHIGLDQFPFPKMRDNAITYSGLYDEEQLAMDLCTMPSFDITHGAAPWDPAAWRMEKGFAEKWGFLFCDPPTTLAGEEPPRENPSSAMHSLERR